MSASRDALAGWELKRFVPSYPEPDNESRVPGALHKRVAA
jgi:hypothetical protein